MSDEPRSGFARCDLVRSAVEGAVAAGAGSRADTAVAAELGPGAAPVELEINGKRRRFALERAVREVLT